MRGGDADYTIMFIGPCARGVMNIDGDIRRKQMVALKHEALAYEERLTSAQVCLIMELFDAVDALSKRIEKLESKGKE